jgi:ribosomal protein S18 acetylase RimI-like enzyme
VRLSPEGVAEGCGAIVFRPHGLAEIKRMFVVPEARGKGLGAAILKSLETHAHEACVRVIRLETGPLQPEAISLYRRFGYRECGTFGTYHADAHSVFMEKFLDASPGELPNPAPT